MANENELLQIGLTLLFSSFFRGEPTFLFLQNFKSIAS